MYNTKQYIGINSLYILRKDENKAILFRYLTGILFYIELVPEAAIIVSYINGKRTIEQLIQSVAFSFNIDIKLAEKSVFNTLNHIKSANFNILIFQDNPIEQLTVYNPKDFLIKSKLSSNTNGKLLAPINLTLMPSSSCHTKCEYCYADLENLKKCSELSLKKWITILNEITDLNIPILTFSGTDPFAYKDIISLLIECCKRQILFSVSTKCYVSYEDAKRLVDEGFNTTLKSSKREFQVSLDSLDNEIATTLVGVPHYVNRMLDTIKNLIRAGIFVSVQAVLTTLNVHNIKGFINTLSDLGVKEIKIRKYNNSKYKPRNDYELSHDQIKDVVNDLKKLNSNHKNIKIIYDDLISELLVKDNSSERRTSCSAGISELIILPDGRAIPCESCPAEDPFVVGDLKESSLLEIWNGSKLSNLRSPSKDAILNLKCRKCSFLSQCIDEGFCFVDNYNESNDLFIPDNHCRVINLKNQK